MAAAASQPVSEQLTPPDDSIYVFTDIETDSISAKLLLQIAAVTPTGDKFNIFINPKSPLTKDCSDLLGLFYFNGDLYREGTRLYSKPIKTALFEFMKWISKQPRTVTLVFHNGFSFDCTVLAKFLTQFKIPIAENLLFVADTLPYLRRSFKDDSLENHKLGTLAKHFNISHDLAHDAYSDCLTLMLICNHIVNLNETCYQEIFKESSRPFSTYLNRQLFGTPIKPLKRKRKIRNKKDNSQKELDKHENC